VTISNRFELANDAEFRLLANFTTPPRAGRVTGIEPSGQVRVASHDADGGDVLAWPLNGFSYAVDDLVYITFAENSPDSALVIGSLASLPQLDAGVLPQGYVPLDGSEPLTADWDIGAERRIRAEAMRARDGEGLRLEDAAGGLGLLISEGGNHGFGTTAPQGKLHAHDGVGSMLFVSKSGIVNVAQTMIANGTGDVTGGLTGFFVVSAGSSAAANMLTMLPGDTLDIVVGGYTLRLALNVNGALTAIRQSGTGTASLTLLAVWM
jgi:hypothetical protein